MQGFDFSRALIGLQCLGAAQQTVEETWRYVGSAEAFDRPLSKNQGVAFPLAEAETLLSAARLLCYQTLWLKDVGLPHTAQAAMCKWWAPKTAYDVIDSACCCTASTATARSCPSSSACVTSSACRSATAPRRS